MIKQRVNPEYEFPLKEAAPSLSAVPKTNSESGQSTIEFALTMILFLAFFLFYFQLAMAFAFASYAHYATFMSARALFAAGGGGGSPDQKEQITRATNVLVFMVKKSAGQTGVDKFPSIAKATGGSDPTGATIGEGAQFQQGNSSYSWQQGVQYTFKSNLFLIPLAGTGQGTGGGSQTNTLQLTAESWLGRSVSNAECASSMSGSVYDNGC